MFVETLIASDNVDHMPVGYSPGETARYNLQPLVYHHLLQKLTEMHQRKAFLIKKAIVGSWAIFYG